jgi:putative ABC transport system permease protein
VAVAGDEGANPDTLARDADAALRAFPQTDALTIDQFKDKQAQAVNQLLGLVFALLALSVIVALLGIVNTLALSVHERTRELGMLRAVGMTRRQVRRMVRAESVITAGIGAILGIVLGVVFALIISRPLAEQGFVFTLPIGTLILFFVLAALAGVVAAIPPARRASKVDVLRAVTSEQAGAPASLVCQCGDACPSSCLPPCSRCPSGSTRAWRPIRATTISPRMSGRTASWPWTSRTTACMAAGRRT